MLTHRGNNKNTPFAKWHFDVMNWWTGVWDMSHSHRPESVWSLTKLWTVISLMLQTCSARWPWRWFCFSAASPSLVSLAFNWGIHTNDAASKFDAGPGTDCTIFFTLSIARHVKFDTHASTILTPPCLCENPQSHPSGEGVCCSRQVQDTTSGRGGPTSSVRNGRTKLKTNCFVAPAVFRLVRAPTIVFPLKRFGFSAAWAHFQRICIRK